MISNYWLGTFNLLTLQFVSVVTPAGIHPLHGGSLLILPQKRGGRLSRFPRRMDRFRLAALHGVPRLPWGMLGASQYSVIPLIQIASLTGVWGVTFLMTLCNAVIAWYAAPATLTRAGRGPAAAVDARRCTRCRRWDGRASAQIARMPRQAGARAAGDRSVWP